MKSTMISIHSHFLLPVENKNNVMLKEFPFSLINLITESQRIDCIVQISFFHMMVCYHGKLTIHQDPKSHYDGLGEGAGVEGQEDRDYVCEPIWIYARLLNHSSHSSRKETGGAV